MALHAIPDQAALRRAVLVDHGDKVAVQLLGIFPHPEGDGAVGALIALTAPYGTISVTHS